MNQKSIALLIACVSLSACGSTTLTRTGETHPAREPTCDFQVFTTPPASGFTEIGTIDVVSGAYGSNSYMNVDDFKEEIRPKVCNAGGDAAIAYANGRGFYIKATVLKKSDEPPQPSAPSDQPTVAAASSGCQYDTQCKGDRVCVEGACVEPAQPKQDSPEPEAPPAAAE